MPYDVLIIGGGLAGSLTAWRLASHAAAPRVCVVESGATLGGNHTWSFHTTDVRESARVWLEPLIVARWSGHHVRFPGHERSLEGSYAAITSGRLHAVIAPALGAGVRLNSRVAGITRRDVTLATGEVLTARLVIDARGGVPPGIPSGWQTFLGQELELTHDHGVASPVLMDATVPQAGGFRFMYLLPWSPTRLLVEDTLYADGPDIDAAACRRRIAEYATAHGWCVREVVREEQGALPVPLSGSARAFWPDDTIRIGVRAGLFHPTTGYSLGDAVATAELLTALDLSDPDAVYDALRRLSLVLWRQRAFYRLLNRLLFRAARPELRVRVLEQFYGRPEALIARFYGARLTWFDRCRLLAGRPPVPLTRALAHWRATPS